MTPAERLSGLTLESAEGPPVSLGDLWREKTAVIAWVRHFG
jgi:hypothetical protein